MTVHPIRPPKQPKPKKNPTGVSISDTNTDIGLTISLDYDQADVKPFPKKPDGPQR